MAEGTIRAGCSTVLPRASDEERMIARHTSSLLG
jgi:hypothetical protein